MFGLTDEELTAIRLSVLVAGWATAASLPPAVLVALVLARGRFPGVGLLNGLVLYLTTRAYILNQQRKSFSR